MNKKQNIHKLIEAIEKITNKKVCLIEKENKSGNFIGNTKVILSEAKDYTNEITELLKSKPGLSFAEILNEFGITPKSAGQIAVFGSLKKALQSGAIKREPEGRSFKYFIGDGTPSDTRTQLRRPKIVRTQDEVESDLRALGFRINDHYNDKTYTYELTRDGSSVQVYVFTGVRGPRTDHGGGPDGNGWLNDYQIDKLQKTYAEKFKSTIERIKKYYKEKKIKVPYIYVDYGEKGHVSIVFKLSR